MIAKIGLGDFKGFLGESFVSCGPLTLLSGLNSAGKSSVLQGLLVLRQSAQQNMLSAGKLALNGELVQLGRASDVLSERSDRERVGFFLSFTDGTSASWVFNYDRDADVLNAIGDLPPPEIFSKSLFTDRFHYLSAERLGPRTHFEISEYQVREHRQLGPRGEFAAHYLSVFGERPQPTALRRSHPATPSAKLTDLVSTWLSVISPGVRLRLTPVTGADLVQLSFAFASRREVSSYYRATNVGFGLTYTLPVLVALLAAEPGHLILLENPEAHLHPRGQAQLGRLIALCAADGVQVLVESHSDHVLNGIRLAVHSGELTPEKTQIHFFQRAERSDGALQNILTSPRLDPKGRFDRWPEGFFDEWERSLDALIGDPSPSPEA